VQFYVKVINYVVLVVIVRGRKETKWKNMEKDVTQRRLEKKKNRKQSGRI
jgi:hypothetical protein